MLNIFYQKKTLNDTLIINVSLQPVTSIKQSEDITIGFNDTQPVFINVANVSKKIDTKLLPDGLLFPTKELTDHIKTITGVDWLLYFNNGFKVAKIEQCDDVPGTHLHKCKVNVGGQKLDIVCGAPNAKVGLITVCATNGTMLPSGKPIIAGQLLGNKSEGMLCSYRELMIDKPSNGIIELDENYNVGDYFYEVYANKR